MLRKDGKRLRIRPVREKSLWSKGFAKKVGFEHECKSEGLWMMRVVSLYKEMKYQGRNAWVLR